MPQIKFDTETFIELPKSEESINIEGTTTGRYNLKNQSSKPHIGFILDESSSMVTVWQDTISGFNSYITQLREEIPEASITFATFVADEFKLRGDDKPIDEVLPLNSLSYTPYGSTPLVDSIMKLIVLVEQKVNVDPELKPLIVIQTDGSENTSKNYTMKDLKACVERKRKLGWRFILITCGYDPNKLADNMGVDPSTSIEYGRGKTKEAFKIVARITTASLKTGEEAVFSLEDKRRLK